jgi:hypothetical protein
MIVYSEPKAVGYSQRPPLTCPAVGHSHTIARDLLAPDSMLHAGCQPRQGTALLRAVSRTRAVVSTSRLSCAGGQASGYAVRDAWPGPRTRATPISVVETSLGFGEQLSLLRHLGIRAGDENDFVEAHFGPGQGGSLTEGFLKYGEGKVAESEYFEVIASGALSAARCQLQSLLVRNICQQK